MGWYIQFILSIVLVSSKVKNTGFNDFRRTCRIYMNKCPLCGDQTIICDSDRQREYMHCSGCGLIHVPERFHLDAESQKIRYDLHKNSPDDSGYVKHLSMITSLVSKMIAKGARGLDYGSGPTPVMSDILKDSGYSVDQYDLFYANDSQVLDGTYDFVISAETVEHIFDASTMWSLFSKLVPSGHIFIMTLLYDDPTIISKWHYVNDLTHVVFYCRRTIEKIARDNDFRIEHIDKKTIVFRNGYGK